MSSRYSARRAWLRGSSSLRGVPIAGFTAAASLSVAALGVIIAGPASAGQLPAGAFQAYDPANASTIQPGPFSLYTVSVDQLQPTQLNEGFTEVDKKADGFNVLQPSQLQSNLLPDIEPVVIGPGGILYLTDGHHTFTALEDSSYGASDPTVYVNVIANYSNLTIAQFWAQMQTSNLLLPLNDGVAEPVNTATGSPIPTALTGLTSDVYRGLEYSILKNKNSKLFTNAANIAGATGSAIPGLDKITGLYGDFIWADAYRNADGGLGLPTLSPGDIQLATQWNLNGASVTSEPNVGTVTVAQLPGFILSSNINIGTTISDATLSTGTLDGNGTFTGITSFNLGTASEPIIVGTPQSGLVMQLGADSGHTVTLSGTNTYTGGTTIIAGDLIIASDAALGAASSGFTYDANNIRASVQAANGIIFNSLTEGNGTLTIGTTTGGSFSTNRPIAVDGEAATINVNDHVVTLTGQLVSLGTNGVGLGNATGVSDLTIDDDSGVSAGSNISKLILSTASPDFFGNIIIGNNGAPIVEVMSDAALGGTMLNGQQLPADELGQIELNSGTFQVGAADFTSARNIFLGGGSSFDTNGFTSTVFTGTLTDVQRTLTIVNSGATAGAVSFGSLAAGSTAIIALDAGTGTTGGPGTAVTFTDGITRNGNSDAGASANATVFIDPSTGSTLGSSAVNGVEVFSSGPSTTLTNGIVLVWIVTDSGGSASSNPYNFLTYGAKGYTVATYTGTFGASNVVQVSSSTSLNANSQAYALNLGNSKTITIGGGDTLTVGDGTDPAGLILEGTTIISGGTLAFGSSEAVIDVKATNTISSAVTGTGGLTLSGSGTLVLSGTAGGLSGPIIVDSGTLQLNTANYFPTSGGGTTIWLSNVKSKPSAAILTVDANNVISALNSDGNNSSVNVGSGVALTIGDGNNLNSALQSTITETGTAVTGTLGGALGAINKNGTGLLDISGGSVTLVTNSNVLVNAGALRIGNGVFSASATNPILVASGAELQYSGNGGSKFNDPIQGGGDFNLLAGTVQLTGTNTYTAGTVIQVGATLDVTTANLPIGGAINNAGGTLVFDQTTTGTFSGVMSDGQQAGGPNDPNDIACTLVSCSGPMLSGILIKDDSTTGSAGNVTLSQVQAYSGMTYIEAGTLTLGAVDTIETSTGVVLGRVGGAVCNPSPCSGVTASLALGANNTVKGIMDDASNMTSVRLDGYTLTLAPAANTSWTYGGSIVDGTVVGSTPGLTVAGSGNIILTGTSTYTGPTVVDGTLEVDGSITNSTSFTVATGGTLVGVGNVDPPTMTIMSGGNFAPGTPGMPGTSMTVTGNLAFQSGANYIVQLNPTTSTFANVTGTAALGGANVLAAFLPGSYMVKQYTILESTGLGGTTFGTLGTSNLPSNFNASLSYDSNNAYLNLAAELGSGGGLGGNQQNVANALNNFFNSGGTLPPNFATIFGLSGGNLNAALAQLSGEANTGAEQASFSMMSSFLGAMIDPTAQGRGGNGGVANGFASEQPQDFPPDIALAYASVLKAAPPPLPFQQRWTAWGQGFGGYNKTNGDPGAGTNTVTATAYGFAGGLDYHVTPETVAGFALAGSGSNWSLAQNLGTGRSDSLQVGLYGTTRQGPAYVSGSVAFTNHWMRTDRTAPLGNQLSARFDAQSYGGRVEAGYRYAVAAAAGVTPYAALQTQLFHTPSYSETDLTGGGFGLSYAAMNATDTRSELGARFDNLQVVDNMPLIWRARLAWAHDWVSNPVLTATFETLPGANFVTNGAGIPANSALSSVGAELHITANWSVEAKFDGDFAGGSQTYAGSGTVRYAW
jgi:outer membrane autotransporter protein